MNPIPTQEQTDHKIVTPRAELPAAKVNPIPTQEQMEQKTIAQECVADFRDLVQWYRTHEQLSDLEAYAKVQENAEADAQRTLRHRSAKSVGSN